MSGSPSGRMTAPPVVSVIMANDRGAAHLARAMASVLAQIERRLELTLADDASDDDSVAIARRFAAQDPRLRVIASARNAGPAATRNLALDMAEGTWIAVVDSDDLIHPERLARLIGAAGNAGVGMVADDLVYFGDVPGRQPARLPSPPRGGRCRSRPVCGFFGSAGPAARDAGTGPGLGPAPRRGGGADRGRGGPW